MSSSCWETVVLGDLADDWKQIWKPAESTQEFVDHYSIPAYDNGMRPSRDRPSDIKSNKRVVASDAVLVSRLNPTTPRIWAPTLNPSTESVCSGEMLVLRPSPGIDRGYLEYLCKSPYVSRAMLQRVSGTTGSHQRVSPRDVLTLTVPFPPLEEQRAIAEVLGSLDDAIENRLAQHRGRVELLMSLGSVPHHVSLVGGFELTIGGDWGADEPDDSHTDAVLCLRGKDLEDLLAGAADDIPVRYLKPSSVNKRRLQPGDVLTAGSGTLGPTLLITESLLSGFSLPLVYSNFVKRIRTSSTDAVPASLFAALHGMWKSGSISQFRTGTAMPNLDAKALVTNVVTSVAFKAIPHALVDNLLSFDDIAAVRALRSTRNAFLPKLISGELRIEDPERLLDQVA